MQQRLPQSDSNCSTSVLSKGIENLPSGHRMFRLWRACAERVATCERVAHEPAVIRLLSFLHDALLIGTTTPGQISISVGISRHSSLCSNCPAIHRFISSKPLSLISFVRSFANHFASGVKAVFVMRSAALIGCPAIAPANSLTVSGPSRLLGFLWCLICAAPRKGNAARSRGQNRTSNPPSLRLIAPTRFGSNPIA